MSSNPSNPGTPQAVSNLRDKVTLNISMCKRCGTSHEDIDFHRFGVADNDYTHWAYCPTTGEPLLLDMRVARSKKPDKFVVDFVTAGNGGFVPHNPRYPHGKDVRPAAADLKTHCICHLPYPAESPGSWRARCSDCQAVVSCAAGGHRSDPKTVAVICRS